MREVVYCVLLVCLVPAVLPAAECPNGCACHDKCLKAGETYQPSDLPCYSCTCQPLTVGGHVIGVPEINIGCESLNGTCVGAGEEWTLDCDVMKCTVTDNVAQPTKVKDRCEHGNKCYGVGESWDGDNCEKMTCKAGELGNAYIYTTYRCATDNAQCVEELNTWWDYDCHKRRCDNGQLGESTILTHYCKDVDNVCHGNDESGWITLIGEDQYTCTCIVNEGEEPTYSACLMI